MRGFFPFDYAQGQKDKGISGEIARVRWRDNGAKYRDGAELAIIGKRAVRGGVAKEW
jgi:hypothetical protein